jgi:hypothetical protein
MASLYANIAQVGRPADLAACFGVVTTLPAHLINATDYGIAVGIPPTCSRSTAAPPAMAVAELARPLLGPRAWPPQFFATPWRPSIVRQTHPSPADKISYRLVFRQTAYRAPADANAIDADQRRLRNAPPRPNSTNRAKR